jgi:uncharacterized Tic20 family protein
MICKIEYYTRKKCMLLILEAISLYTDSYKWMSIQSCLNWLVEVIPHGDRVGPLVVAGLVNDSSASANWKVPPAINYQVCFFTICTVSVVGYIYRPPDQQDVAR